METNLKHLSIDDNISQAWALTKKHLPIFLVLMILTQVVGGIPQSVYYNNYLTTMMESGAVMSEQEWMNAIEPAELISTLIYTSLAGLVCWFIYMFLIIVTYRLANDAAKGEKPDLTARLKDGLRGYWFFFGCYLVYSLLVGIGTVCCLLPGIFLGIRLLFVPIIAALHPERTFSECLSQSWQITKGSFWNLFLLGVIAFFLAILGLICCCVGVLVTSIITYFMLILAYRTLSGEAEEKTEDVVSENLTVVSE